MFGFPLSRSALACTYAAVSLLVVSPSYVYAQETRKDALPSSVDKNKEILSSSEVKLFFLNQDGEGKIVSRHPDELNTKNNQVRDSTGITAAEKLITQIAYALIQGPTENEKIAGAKSIVETGTVLEDFRTEQNSDSSYKVSIYLKFPDSYIESGNLDWLAANEINNSFIKSMHDVNVVDFLFYFYNPLTDSYVEPIELIDPQFSQSQKELSEKIISEKTSSPLTDKNVTAPPAPVTGNIVGALSGKTVVLNQSHGFFYDQSADQKRWRVQRSKLYEMLEDFSSAEFMNLYVIPALMNAGAIVKPVREPDHQTNRVIVDNSDAVKTGSWSVSSFATGFKNGTYVGRTANPFGYDEATEFTSAVSGTPTASAKYPLPVTSSGYYNVYVAYSMGSNRSTDAHYEVGHSGGKQEFRINQQKNGGMWLLLGNFYFEAGAPESERTITVFNDTKVDATKVVTIDAVRIGGGTGIIDRRNVGLSGRPAWQEEAMHYMQFNGFSASSLYPNSSTSIDENLGWSGRSQYANWEQTRNSDGNNTVYLGWHTNASQGKCSGGVETEGVARGVETLNGSNASQNSKNFTTATYTAYLDAVRKFYYSSFPSRGMKTSNISEANQNYLGTVAGTVFEGLFHDRSDDAAMYKDPKFRMLAARALTQGIISYYGGTVFPPEPPVNFQVKNLDNNQVQLSWASGLVRTSTQPYGHSATSYRIYKSKNGFGFDSGTSVGNILSTVLTLEPGEVAFFRIVAVNAGGVSFPTETLGVGVPSLNNNKQKVLVINGFDRLNESLAPLTSSTNIYGCVNPNTWRNIDYRRFNSFNYTVQHGKAIAAAGYPFDSTCNELVNNGSVDLKVYPIVDWIGGQEAEVDTGDNVNDEAFTAAEMAKIQEYLTYGGRLFVSNSKLGWDFGRSSATTAKRNFYNNYLKATYVAEKASVTASVGSGTGIFSGLGTLNFNGDAELTYNPEACVISPTGGAVTAMTFSGGTYSGQAAAIQYSGQYSGSQYTSRLVNMSFGFETIRTEAARNNVMARILNYFSSIPPTEDRYYVPTNSEVQRWNNY